VVKVEKKQTKVKKGEKQMKKLGLLISVLVLVSCAPQPTPDLKATETAIAHNVLATLTAQVPTPTLTPEATNTPEPTSTPKPTNTPKPTSTPVATSTPTVTSTPTATPKPTATPTPTATATPEPTATPEATATPEEWQVYESLDGNFTLAYSSSWEIQEEGVNSVTLQPLGPNMEMATLRVSFLKGGAILFGKDDEENVRITAIELAETIESMGLEGFKVMDKGVWKGSVYKGYFCEYAIYIADSPVYARVVMIPVADNVVMFSYSRVLSEDLTAEDYEAIETTLETMRVK